jgi:hypothetical protein
MDIAALLDQLTDGGATNLTALTTNQHPFDAIEKNLAAPHSPIPICAHNNSIIRPAQRGKHQRIGARAVKDKKDRKSDSKIHTTHHRPGPSRYLNRKHWHSLDWPVTVLPWPRN